VEAVGSGPHLKYVAARHWFDDEISERGSEEVAQLIANQPRFWKRAVGSSQKVMKYGQAAELCKFECRSLRVGAAIDCCSEEIASFVLDQATIRVRSFRSVKAVNNGVGPG